MAASERPFMELAAWALQIVHQPLPWRSLPLVIALFATGAFLVFFGVGSLLHAYFYVWQASTPERWKIQPKVWLSRTDHLHELALAAINLLG